MLRSEKDAWSTIKWPRQLTKKRVRFPPPSPLGFAYLSTKQVIGLSGSTGQTTLVYAERSTPVCSSTSSGVKRQLHPARSTRKNQTSGKKARGNQLIFSRKIVGTNEGTTLSVSRGGKKVVRWDKQRARNNPGEKPLVFLLFFLLRGNSCVRTHAGGGKSALCCSKKTKVEKNKNGVYLFKGKVTLKKRSRGRSLS